MIKRIHFIFSKLEEFCCIHTGLSARIYMIDAREMEYLVIIS